MFAPLPTSTKPKKGDLPFLVGSSVRGPTKIDYRKKVGTLILTSLLEDPKRGGGGAFGVGGGGQRVVTHGHAPRVKGHQWAPGTQSVAP